MSTSTFGVPGLGTVPPVERSDTKGTTSDDLRIAPLSGRPIADVE